MPFHVFLSQSLSLLTGGLDVWKLAKDVALGMFVVFTFCLVWRKRREVDTLKPLLLLGVFYLLLHFLVWTAHPAIYRNSALLGIIYNNRLFGYAFVGLGAGLLLGVKEMIKKPALLLRLTVGISTLVAIFGVAQYFLPHNILAHVGYGVDRGTLPAFFIDNKPNLPRIMSTLRDPNSLGAYLILPITALTALLLTSATIKRRVLLTALLALHAAALVLTFSRGAWAAALLSIGLLVAWQYGRRVLVLARRYWLVLAVMVALCGIGLFAARHTYILKSALTHSTGKPQAAYDSNGFHWVFAKRGLEGIVHNPFGHGPGTAGLASIQNPAGSFLTENYYIQVGYEVGIIGVGVFVAMNVWVYRALLRHKDRLLVLSLLCSFWAYVLMNMLFHMWSNEAVAAQWWILAGFGLALPDHSRVKAAKTTRRPGRRG